MFRKKDGEAKIKKADIPDPTTSEELRSMASRLQIIAKQIEILQKRKDPEWKPG